MRQIGKFPNYLPTKSRDARTDRETGTWRQVQREAGEMPELDEDAALRRVIATFNAVLAGPPVRSDHPKEEA